MKDIELPAKRRNYMRKSYKKIRAKKMHKKQKVTVTIRNHKDTIFRMIFKSKKELLILYNAVNGTHYTNPDDLQITTLENAIYMNMKNDVSCVLDMRMNLYEHQSTFNPNMPLRDLFYIARLYENLVVGENIYSSKRILLPTPKFIIFYNGVDEQPERKVMKLSDSFAIKGEVNLELIAVQLNINPGYNEELKRGCPILYQYVCYVEKVRKNRETMFIEEAVRKAVDDCIKENILKDFLLKNKAEMIQMSIFEYDEEKHKKFLRQEGFEDGLECGLNSWKETIIEILEELGDMPDYVKETILSETNLGTLKKWNKLAAKADSIEKFVKSSNMHSLRENINS